MRRLLRALFRGKNSWEDLIGQINRLRGELAGYNDAALQEFARSATGRVEIMAAAAVAASRILGLEMFEEQLRGAIALTEGRIAEMQTGEGKTLAAVPAVICYAKAGAGVHVMTVNDYLARRDAQWM